MAIEQWNFDPVHSSINFTVRHLVVSKVHGRFTKWSGTLLVDADNPAASRVEVEIEVASVDTHEQKRDDHLRSADFFEVEKFPTMTFKSTGVEKTADDEYRLRGDLTLRGVTRPVELLVEYSGEVKDPWGGQRLGATARTTINRKDFGVAFHAVAETGQLLVCDKVDISIDVEAVKQVPAAALT